MADVDAVRAFLEQDLLVPPAQIRTLCDEEATREGIIQAWGSLGEDDGIEKDDAILIYYSGHGGSSPAPEGWSVGEENAYIQCLIPHDYGLHQPLTDRMIGHLTDELALAKGDNIVSGLTLMSRDSVFKYRRSYA